MIQVSSLTFMWCSFFHLNCTFVIKLMTLWKMYRKWMEIGIFGRFLAILKLLGCPFILLSFFNSFSWWKSYLISSMTQANIPNSDENKQRPHQSKKKKILFFLHRLFPFGMFCFHTKKKKIKLLSCAEKKMK